MNVPANLTSRQSLEGMPLVFKPDAAPGLTAVIQFNVTGAEPGVYHLTIADGECQFHTGAAAAPTLTITTPSDIWLKVSNGELSGQDALMQGLYQANGDLSLLLRMDSLFGSSTEAVYEAPPSQRPAGPIRLSGMAWMAVAFIPWIIHWSTFDIPGVSHWISVGLPLLLSALIVGYRLFFSRRAAPSAGDAAPQPPTLLEWGGLGFFAAASLLVLIGDNGFPVWGSVIGTLIMGALWLSSLLFSDSPLSTDYAKWTYVKALWRNSMFIYPNAVISLMWGWLFIVSALFGVAAILLPRYNIPFTVARYLLLIPAFIFTSVYQKRATQLKVKDYATSMGRLRFWAGLGLSAISGLLLAATMPGLDVGLLGWFSLVPLVMVITVLPLKKAFWLALPFGLAFSIGVHNWYPHIFSPALGYFLIFAVGAFYAGIIHWGAWLQSRLPGALKLLALPVAWAAVEFIKFIAPVVNDWWFVLLAKSQWRFPPALQILSVTGFPGLSFLIMLANVALAFILLRLFWRRNGETEIEIPSARSSVAALAVVGIIVAWGALTIPQPPADAFTIAALTDMANQDPAVQAQGEFAGTAVNDPAASQAIFDLDAGLTRSIADLNPAFVVWPENEIADADDPHFTTQIGDLAAETGSYIVADMVWRAPTGMHDTAVMFGPAGAEVGRRAKINTTAGEEDAGFVPGPPDYPVFTTPYGDVGLGVCWDRHRLGITRELARSGADIVLMPVDDDFDGTPTFPPFHASDGVFRAAENRVAFGLGTINGLSMVIDPYGRITAEGGINESGVTIGETFIAPAQTLYTRLGDWFGWLMTMMLVGFIAIALLGKRRHR